MKRSLLSALLLSALAASASAQGAASPPAVTPPAPAISLSAPVGTAIELVSSSSSQISVSDVEVTALPGSDQTPEELAQMRQSILDGLSNASRRPQLLTGKAFFRVAARGGDGTTTLLSTVVQPVPGQPTVTLSFTQTISPTGQLKVQKVTSSNPQMQALFAGLTSDRLLQLTQQSSGGLGGGYGLTLVPGQSRTNTVTVNVQEMLGGLLASITGPQSVDQLATSPLTMTTVTTYNGLNAQGQHTLTSQATASPWSMTMQLAAQGLGMQGPEMKLELTSLKIDSTMLYRRDGLPAGSAMNQQFTMRMSIPQQGVLVKMTMNLAQTVTLRPR